MIKSRQFKKKLTNENKQSEEVQKQGFLARHGIIRNAIRKDMIYFAIPALIVFVIGLGFCGNDNISRFWGTVWNLLNHPENINLFPAESIIGICLVLIGLTIMVVGQATLWKNYSGTVVIRKDHKLITHGIYHSTRNPIYFGAIIAVIFGLPLYSASLYGFLTFLLLIPIVLKRIKLEEELLTEEFPDRFPKYKKTTKKLILFIY